MYYGVPLIDQLLVCVYYGVALVHYCVLETFGWSGCFFSSGWKQREWKMYIKWSHSFQFSSFQPSSPIPPCPKNHQLLFRFWYEVGLGVRRVVWMEAVCLWILFRFAAGEDEAAFPEMGQIPDSTHSSWKTTGNMTEGFVRARQAE